MAITIKTAEQIEKMRIAGQLAASVLEMIEPHVKTGVTTGYLDQLCHNYIVDELDAIPAPLNYNGFPKSICTSINNVVCHGIPGDKKLKKGTCEDIRCTGHRMFNPIKFTKPKDKEYLERNWMKLRKLKRDI